MRWLTLVRLGLLHFQSLPIAALITLQTLREALAVFGYPAVTFFIMIESMGVPFPGETMLLLASFYSAIDSRLQIPIVIACAALGAILGDNIGYSNVVETKRTSEKRPEWGILQARNSGINQRGEQVFSFLATAFVPRRKIG